MNKPNPSSQATTGPSKVGVLVLVAIAAAAGVFGGMRWHTIFPPKAPQTSTQMARQLWTCSMHPQVIQDHPGLCPICKMQLTPVRSDVPGGGGDTAPDAPIKGPPVVTIDPAVVQNIGVRTVQVTKGPLHQTIRLVGYFDEAQTQVHDINLQVSGWIKHLYAHTEGMHLKQGEALFELDSPELRLAVEELSSARRVKAQVQDAPSDALRRSSDARYEAAAMKLERWGLPRTQIDALSKLDQAPQTITFASPVTGDVTEKGVVEGGSVKAGDRVLRIVDHSLLWLDAQAFEDQVPRIAVGQHATVTLVSDPAHPIQGTVTFIDPRVDPTLRTTRVRLEVQNPDLKLRPGMYATVRIDADGPMDAVIVPREAVIDTGERQIAFITPQPGHFEPRLVRLGASGDGGMVQVLEGLSPGEEVVTSGQFLLDSESRMREAVQKYLQAGAPSAKPPVMSGGSQAPELTAKIDVLVGAYLSLSDKLGAETPPKDALDGASLRAAAEALTKPEAPGELADPIGKVVAAARDFAGANLAHQRELFKPLSEAVIGLVERQSPSSAVGAQLYVVHCPMFPGDWIQSHPEIANPFYEDMKECGKVVRTIATSGSMPR